MLIFISMVSLFSHLFSLPKVLPPQAGEGSVRPGFCLSGEEMKLYDMIMEYRHSKGLKGIPLSYKLTKVAQYHVRDLQDNFDLGNVDTCNPHSWSEKGRWKACCYSADHAKTACMWEKPREIAAYEGNGYEIAYYSSKGASAEEGLEGWKRSPGHNPLLINTGMWEQVEWQAIGIALYGGYGVVWFGELLDDQEPDFCN